VATLPDNLAPQEPEEAEEVRQLPADQVPWLEAVWASEQHGAWASTSPQVVAWPEMVQLALWSRQVVRPQLLQKRQRKLKQWPRQALRPQVLRMNQNKLALWSRQALRPQLPGKSLKKLKQWPMQALRPQVLRMNQN
jgi:hypothetical protein